MKTIKCLVVLCILFCLTANESQSQAIVVKDQSRVLLTGYGFYFPVDSYAVLTPSGNLLISATYQLDPEDPLVPDEGVNKVAVWGGTGGFDWIWDDRPYTFTDAEMIVTSDGKARLIYHLKHTEYYQYFQ